MSERRPFYRYRLIDVFAERPFSGKPTAVFTDATGLEEWAMRVIARELNCPQTTFVFPQATPDAPLRVRIFTPSGELTRGEPPTLATVYALDCEARLEEVHSKRRIVLEQADGPVSVSQFARITTVKQPLPVFGRTYAEPAAVAAMLGLTMEDLAPLPLRAVSSGVPYLMVPVKKRERLEAIKFRSDIWERTVRHFEAPHLMAFSLETERTGSVAKARVFMPAVGVVEDPATESACGSLVLYLIANGLVSLPSAAVVTVEQGAEIGRPSFINVAVLHDAGTITEIRVGGNCQLVAEGVIYPP